MATKPSAPAAQTKPNALVKVDAKEIAKIDTYIKKARNELAAIDPDDTFAMVVAQANFVNELSNMITDEMMGGIMELQNHPLGFKTDKSAGYSISEVKLVVIDAMFHGLPPVRNRINIIGGRLYVPKEGFEFLNEKLDIRDLVVKPGVPKMDGAQKAIVTVKASWRYKGKKYDEEETFSIRVNSGQTDDAILGKARRKMGASIHRICTGAHVPSGDVEDIVDVEATIIDHETDAAEKIIESQVDLPELRNRVVAMLKEAKITESGEVKQFIEWATETSPPTPLKAMSAKECDLCIEKLKAAIA